MVVVAEGIETAEQLAQLKSLECEYGQGYFFSPPLNSGDMLHWLSRDQMPALVLSPFNNAYVRDESALVA